MTKQNSNDQFYKNTIKKLVKIVQLKASISK